MVDEDFLLALQTHMARVTVTVVQDTEFLIQLSLLATADPRFRPMYQRFFTLTSNQTEALLDINKDIGEMMRWGSIILAGLSASK